MANREEALRRIFEAAGMGARLTDDQKRELLAHLEDAVEKKVGAGVPEMDALGQAFSELGDLRKIAREFPSGPPAAVTPEGPVLDRWFPGSGWTAFVLFLFFGFIQLFIIPTFRQIYQQVRVTLPGLTLMIIGLSDAMRTYWPLTAAFALVLGAALWLSRRSGVPAKAAQVGLFLVGALLCTAALVGVCLPLLSLLEGVGVRR
jgi:hypothetical protein